MSRIYAINGSHRNKGNTAQILEHFLAGAASAGAETELIQLGKLTFTGCTSCFACKRLNGPSYGKCALQDDLTAVLTKLRQADGIGLGTPIYFGAESALFRAFMERLLFSALRYNQDYGSLAEKPLRSAFFYTMNITSERMREFGYRDKLSPMLGGAERLLKAPEPPSVQYVYNTWQFDDYAKYDASAFDPEHKAEVRKKQFPLDCQKAFETGKEMAQKI